MKNDCIQYKLVNRVDPLLNEGELKIAPVPIYRGDSDFQLICQLVSERSLLTEADVEAILQAFVTKASIYLLNSRVVQMGDLGYLTVALKTDQVDNPDNYTRSNIRKVHVVFVPSNRVRANLKTMDIRSGEKKDEAVPSPDTPTDA
jgi:hypothetical protein